MKIQLFEGLLLVQFASSLLPLWGDTLDEVTPALFPRVVVVGTNAPLTSPSMNEAGQQFLEVPGGFTLRDTHDMERGRASGFEELLARVPGVISQGENGNEVGEVSIRGSGVLSDEEPIGVQFLLDGFTMNQADGETILEDFDLSGIKYAEVFRGANAFEYGATTLGGSINLASRTGYDARPLELSLEGGSFGFLRGNVASGGVQGPVDYFVSLTGRSREGFRQHSAENSEDLFANLGWRISNNLENRVYVTLAGTERQISAGTTQAAMMADPRQAGPFSFDQNLNKAWTYSRVADKVTLNTEHERLSAGVYWWHRDLSAREAFTSDSREGILDYYSDNAGFILDSVTRSQVFGGDNVLTLGVSPNMEREVDHNYENIAGRRGATTGQATERSLNAPLYAQDQQHLTEKLSVIGGIQAIYAQRDFHDLFTATDSGDQSANLVFRGLNPKVGLLFAFDHDHQWFANLSRSWQPPSFDNMVEMGDDVDESLQFTPLSPQHAWTAETGARGQHGRFHWELALYHAWVRNELLGTYNPLTGMSLGAVNIPRSYHQGIEAGLEIELLDAVFTRRNGDRANDHLTWEQSYTLTDLHFDHDPLYGNNRIAVIPVHLLEASLTYEHSSGFYAGPTLKWNMSKYPADQANTLFAHPYALVGFRAGLRLKHEVTVFFEAKNLADERYASDIDPISDARYMGASVFHPGDGRAFYAGLTWKL